MAETTLPPSLPSERPTRFRWVDMTDAMRKSLLDWVVDTCLLFGTQRKTAYLVASAFAEGLDREAQTDG